MRDRISLSVRLLGLGLVAAVLCTSVGGWLLRTQLHEIVLRDFEQDLQERTDRLQAEFEAAGAAAAAEPDRHFGDFGQIFSGWYWLLSRGGEVRRSRSLWDSTLAPAQAKPLPQNPRLVRLDGPRIEPLLGTGRNLTIAGEAVRLYVFGPMHDTLAEWRRIDGVLIAAQLAFIAALLAWTVLQVRIGLAPLRRLRRTLAAVRGGTMQGLGRGYGPDLDPIAEEVDAVLARNTRIVERGRHHAADLSHALKKPLALLAAQARDAAIPTDLVLVQIRSMSGLIDRHLSRYGSGAGSVQSVDVGDRAQALLALMRQLHADRGLQWMLDLPAGLRWRGEPSDFDEMVGNLLDNAGKWARGRVRIRAVASTDGRGPAGLQMIVEDDGPGLAVEQRSQALERGRRFDETVAGHGLGLAIVRDIADTYGGRLALGASELGGLSCTLRLP
ncbi:MAG: sensor histidine kinase [Lautropia sp.]